MQDAEYQNWQRRWAEGQTGWDQGAKHPQLPTLLERARVEGGLKPAGRIHAAGCGRAHNEAYLAAQGYEVTAVDLVPEAIAAARGLYASQNRLTLVCGDALTLDATERGTYAAIFDRAMLCALPPDLRPIYVQVSWERLAPGGIWMGILFQEVRNPVGPPFAVTEALAWELFAPHFELCYAGASPDLAGAPAAIAAEWLCIWRRRDP